MANRSRLALFPDGETTFSADLGHPFEIAARVVRTPSMEPASGVGIQFEVIDGPLRLGKRRSRRLTVQTGRDGRAALPAVFAKRGAAIVALDLVPGDAGSTLFLGAHSDGVTHRVGISSPGAVTAGEPAAIPVRVTAVDRHNRPVRAPGLYLEGRLAGSDIATRIRLRRAADGEYEGVLKTVKAGCWRFRAYDALTKVTGDACLQVLPASPARIDIVGSPDPRGTVPYGETWVRARLDDKYGNPLDPHRIRLGVNGAEAKTRIQLDGSARVLIHRPQGHGRATIRLSDSGGSGLTAERTIPFAASWIGDPGFVAAGTTFQTPVFLMPPAGRAIGKATVTLEFEPKNVRFLGMTPTPGVTIEQSEPANGLVAARVTFDRPVRAAHAPDGARVAVCTWECAREGKTCFSATARMSPVTEPWKLCISQKRERQKCLCINIINKEGDLKGMEAGDRAMRTVVKILSTGNIKHCCPSLRIEMHHCRISNNDWRTKVVPAVGARGVINSTAQIDALFALNLCQRKKCINFLMIAMDHSWADAHAGSFGPRPGSDRSFGVINPDYVDSVHNLGAHEVGHDLGLHHVDNQQGENVMSETQPHGDHLTPTQCQELWTHLDQYSC